MSDVAIVVMAHPSRDSLVGKLCAQITGPVTVVRDDDECGPWPTARRAWTEGWHSGAEWIMLLQDDARPADDIRGHARRITRLGDRCVCLHCFDSKRRREGAQKAPGHWMQVRFSTWGQGVMMPRSWVSEFLRWCDHNVPGSYPHDDTRLTWWLQESGRSTWVPLPNLIEHRDVSSTLGHPSNDTMAFEQSPAVDDWSDGLDDAPIVRGSPIDSRYEYTKLER